MSEIIECAKNKPCFVEQECILEHEGKKFESGGTWLAKRKDNDKLEGTFYAYPKEFSVGSWDGSIKVKATFGHSWRSNFGDVRQSIYFTYKGVNFYGVYYKTNSDIVRVREIK
jgi:hypothetical protein